MTWHYPSQALIRKSFFVTLGTLSTMQVIGVPGWAQPTPANDATGTQVTIDGTVFTIDGGTFSGDGSNLFHSFQEFGLESGQIANFLTNPQVMNVLGRVVGGEASSINGLLQLSGSSANLFLMNPAGVVFGADAQLNIPGSFIVTTGNGIQFGDAWFSADGENSFADLTGNPSGFGFALEQAGSIINAGELSVPSGESLVLLGDAVANTGELTAPSGQVVVTAVPGEQFVQLSVPGSLLSLGVSPIEAEGRQPNSWNIPVASLPDLLTVGTSDLGLTANNDSTVQLTESGINVPGESGTAVVSGVVDVSGDTAGDVGVFGEQVALVSSEVQASGETGGGNVLIGGDYRGEGTVPNALRTYVDLTTNISADAIDSGDGGRVIVWSDEATGFYGDISATGGFRLGNGGFVEVSSPEFLAFEGLVDVGANNGNAGRLLLDPQNITIVQGGEEEGEGNSDGVSDLENNNSLEIFQNTFDDENIEIASEFLENLTGSITLEATNDIRVEDGLSLSFDSEQVSVVADADKNGFGDFIMDPSQNLIADSLSISAANVRVGNISSEINVSGVLDITASGDISTENLSFRLSDFPTTEIAEARINLTSGGDTTTGDIIVGSGYGDGGTIDITSSGSITTGNIEADGNDFGIFDDITHNGGRVTLRAIGDIQVGDVNATGDEDAGTAGGSVDVISGDDITIGNILVGTGYGDGGSVSLRSQRNIQSGFIDATVSTGIGEGGTVLIDSAEGVIRVLGANDSNNSIVTQGLEGNEESITIRTRGSLFQPSQPFFAQDSSVLADSTRSGTVGSIVSGVDIIEPRAYEGVFRLNNILIDTGSSFDRPQDIEKPTGNGGTTIPEVTSGGGNENGTGIVEDVPAPNFPDDFPLFDEGPGEDFKSKLDIPPEQNKSRSINEVYEALTEIEDSTGIKPAIVYSSFVPLEVEEGELIHTRTAAEQATDQLELVVVTAGREPIRRRIHGTNRADIIKTADDLREEISKKRPNYRQPGKKLYNWIISPLEQEFETLGIDNLVFIMDEKLRSVPLAAMYNEETRRFVVEDYSIGLMPSLSLTDLSYTDIRESGILARGSETFPTVPNFKPLPGAATEIEILQALEWKGDFGIDESFTRENIIESRRESPYGIVHLATHADFLENDFSNSFIQSWNEKIIIDDIRRLNFDAPPLELLVLSACNTALGNADAELGFAGLAAKAGVKSALASLWFVSDQGTLSLISDFYSQLKHSEDPSTKSDALRRTQIKMIEGKIGIKNGKLQLTDRAFDIPPELAANGAADLSHPYYWAGFTVVGNPW